MFAYARVQQRARHQGPNGQPIITSLPTGQCICGCHQWKTMSPSGNPMPVIVPKASDGRMCKPCADEANQPWTDILASIT